MRLLLLTLPVAAVSQTLDSFSPTANGPVHALAVDADGKILVGGYFTAFNGQTRNNIARLTSAGVTDGSFNPGANNVVYALAIQTNGQILVAGDFTSLGAQPRKYLGRINANGTLDTSFNPFASGPVYCLAQQLDGKILVGGSFTNVGGQARTNIARLNGDGTVDASFNPGADGSIYSVVLQSDGSIVAAGNFSKLGAEFRNRIGRLNTGGIVDLTFDPNANAAVSCLSIQADGKILFGGSFTNVGGQPRNHIARINTDGTLDSSFNTEANSFVVTIALQVDGKILVGGDFTTLAGQPRNRLGRLNADGTADSMFNISASSGVQALTVQTNGQVLVGGYFLNLGAYSRSRIGRINTTSPATESLLLDGSTLSWLRAGSGPEIGHSIFEVSSDGTNWAALGAGTRITGGWQLTVTNYPGFGSIRARGLVSGGYLNGSGWFIEKIASMPTITGQPTSRTNNANTTATFSVGATGATVLNYQWLKAGLALTNGGKFSGAQAPTLSVNNVFGEDAGSFSVVVSNSFGSSTSAVATLTVRDPVITTQPLHQVCNIGQTATFSVGAAGSAPMNYYWRKDVTNTVATGSAALVLTNAQPADMGSYSVVVSNVFSSITSSVVLLSVNLAQADAFNPSADWVVGALLPQPDGNYLAGGNFVRIGGTNRYALGRLRKDGSLDATFAPVFNQSVGALRIQPDNRVLVCGFFSTVDGEPRDRIARLSPEGTLDPTFNPGAGGNGAPYVMAIQTNQAIVLAGSFSMLGGQPRYLMGRLNADGSLDQDFDPQPNDYVYTIALQADGKLLVGGDFSMIGGALRQRISRLNPDGSVDTNFAAAASASVTCVAVQRDGRVLIGGTFFNLNEQPQRSIGRLFADGTLDTSFTTTADNMVSSIAIQSDGKILIGGRFTTVGGYPRNRLARLNSDGSVDLVFNPGANAEVRSLALQADGKILVGGDFTSLAIQPRSYLGRLINPDSFSEQISFAGTDVIWSRTGSSPEVSFTTLEHATNGIGWTTIGCGTRIADGWRWSGGAPPPGGRIRVRGFVAAGYNNGSSYFVEKLDGGPPLIISDDENFGMHTNQFGFNLQFVPGQTVVVEASTNLTGWTPVWTNASITGRCFFSDESPAPVSRRFYRARVQ